MSNIDVNQVLAQMRAMAAQTQGAAAKPVENGVTEDFSSLLDKSIDHVNKTQQEAGALSEAFSRGEENDLSQVMVALQKANVSFQAMVQVRNKLVEAYKDVMNMPI